MQGTLSGVHHSTFSSIVKHRHLSTTRNAPLNIPLGAWDSHMHIVDDRFPLAASAQYKPSAHTMAQAVKALSDLGISNMVIVQPSIYGTDNSCLLDGLRSLTPQHGRGVVEVDTETISMDDLRKWHDLGVRGLRVNLKSRGNDSMSEADFVALLQRYADIARPLNWILQLWVSLSMVPLLESAMSRLNIRVCLDHFGGPSTFPPSASTSSYTHSTLDPYSLPGFQSLISLLKEGKTYVKLSAAYRLSNAKSAVGQARDLRPLALEMLRAAPQRVVYGVDWPHTRFEGRVDAKGLQDATLGWCHELDETGALAERLFRDNAEDLWGATERAAK